LKILQPRFLKHISVSLLLAVFLLTAALAGAEDLSLTCAWDNIKEQPAGYSIEEYEALLKKCQSFYQEMGEDLKQDITKTEQEKKSLNNQISLLAKKIQSLNYQINQGSIMIKDLSGQIKGTEASISQTEVKIEDVKGQLADLLQLRWEEDQKSNVEILLAEEKLSDFFNDLIALEVLNLKTQELLTNVKDLKVGLEAQKTKMDSEKADLEGLVIIQTMQKNESAQGKKEQESLLRFTESEYQKYLEEKKETEEQLVKIGNLLFELLEVPEGGIKFEDAVRIAREISKQTGVRAAFSLAVLWQETKIGKTLGGCFLRDSQTGAGVYIKTGNPAPKTMKPGRDVEPFLAIIKSLNDSAKLKTDAFHTPVSCCMIRDGSYYGWGGAMGPAQFIPSTLMLFKARIEEITGNRPASPWSVYDAFLANSLYLKGLGAGSQTYEKEIYAALKYFGCTSSWCRTYYGQPVMRVAGCLQAYIDSGDMSASCRNLIF